MSSCFNGGAGWPEPVVRVQAVSDTCGETIPERYVKLPLDRPSATTLQPAVSHGGGSLNIPVVDMSMPDSDETVRAVDAACREWGFFQAVNHGVSPELLRRARSSWRGFFRQPAEVRERYANSPATYEGYGSRLGTTKGGHLDWGDYYFLHLLPPSIKSHDKWPSLPSTLRYAQRHLRLPTCTRVACSSIQLIHKLFSWPMYMHAWQGRDGGVRRAGGEAVPEGIKGVVQGAGTRRREAAGSVRRGGRRGGMHEG
uniref:Non-haem dioxygenase N-terminal domain-containing protein n=1 Tax=Aegilops tauschii subsp. strangulata TaxID=200361 RepID=A0A453IB94_AEGTS